ncbi:DNA polymerase-3 subunit beta [Hydrogenivirga caldilitoris]|uniref:Beta sliding clamp n=1 Tax=Hydrogenivirga caldilitoris TaxID=246264 RepID=A0A497XT44_9AQUI|nr:DNA polymerase III subunit beta [Hydrogenivirga caldilitoris]RLJ71474.1 DNA polymerase-3 subunit beta [Hydrogenivirga caldilitoris]
MKLQIDREEFEEALKKAKEATEKKSALPILTNFLLTAEKDRLVIKATDLENYLILSVKADIEEEGSVCVSSRSLSDIVRNLGSAILYIQTDGDKLVITGGRSKFKLPTVPPEDFPEFPEVIEGEETLSGNLILKGIAKTEYAIAKEEARISLQGMYMRGHDNRIHFVGSDGHRLALFEPEGSFSYELLIPRKSLKVVQRLLTGIEDVRVAKNEDGSFAYLTSEDWKLIIRLLEGEYPDYLAVIPSEFSAEVLLDVDETKKALKRLSGLTEGRIFPVKITLSDNLAVLEFMDPEFGEGREEIDIDYVGEPFEIGFNGKYILEALEVLDSEKAWFKFTTPDTAALLESDDYEKDPYRCIIMPMRV